MLKKAVEAKIQERAEEGEAKGKHKKRTEEIERLKEKMDEEVKGLGGKLRNTHKMEKIQMCSGSCGVLRSKRHTPST